jgi:hydroxymethylpyrimidine/phosphomethylpyrimidine kinase
MRHALTIAGSDSGGGAGLQADLKTFAAFGVYGMSAITAVTVQNTCGVTAVAPLSADLVAAQIDAVARDIRVDATKIGMLATAAIIEAVAASIEALELPAVVLDPVMVSSSGQRLLDEDGVGALRLELLPRSHVITPNIPEAEALSGLRIRSAGDRRMAAARLIEMGAAAVVITGGHPIGSSEDRRDSMGGDDGTDAVDLLFDGVTFIESRTPRRRAGGDRTHGTGCTFASALAAGLALGASLAAAASGAQRYVAEAIESGTDIGHGARILDHFWQRHDDERRRR